MEQSYTLQLLRLECMRAQERGGDEPYLTLNNQRIWEIPAGKHMHHRPDKPNLVAAVDFEDTLIFTNLHGENILRLFEADLLNPDDSLGMTPIAPVDAGGGVIQIVFDRDGAEYKLIYRVQIES